jgi:hypothetical protein
MNKELVTFVKEQMEYFSNTMETVDVNSYDYSYADGAFNSYAIMLKKLEAEGEGN